MGCLLALPWAHEQEIVPQLHRRKRRGSINQQNQEPTHEKPHRHHRRNPRGRHQRLRTQDCPCPSVHGRQILLCKGCAQALVATDKSHTGRTGNGVPRLLFRGRNATKSNNPVNSASVALLFPRFLANPWLCRHQSLSFRSRICPTNTLQNHGIAIAHADGKKRILRGSHSTIQTPTP